MQVLSERDRCAHLLRRFGLGASEAEVDYYGKDGFNAAVDRLLAYRDVEEGFDVDLQSLANPKNMRVNMPQTVNWWTLRLIMTRRPLQERMTLFWHDHFATSASKVGAPLMMAAQNETLRLNATGNFRTLLKEVSQDPAMIYWLDNQENVKGHANENFAREVMELFTLGIGHYTEKDVQEGARAFTGWSINRNRVGKNGRAGFLFRPLRHDKGEKAFLGSTGTFDGDDILNILCDQDQTATYLTHKIWDWFVWPDPDAATIAPFARRFRASDLDIRALLRDIMRSSEFSSPKAVRAIVKSPADFCVATLRSLGVGESLRVRIANAAAAPVPSAPAPPDGTPKSDEPTMAREFPRGVLAPAAAAQQSMKSMGMWLLYPPDVSGWKNGQAWITSATMVERIAWGDRLFGQSPGVRYQLRLPAAGLLAEGTPREAVLRLVSVFDAPVKPERLPILEAAAQKAGGGRVTRQNANAVAAAVSRLIFATPEFQFA